MYRKDVKIKSLNSDIVTMHLLQKKYSYRNTCASFQMENYIFLMRLW